MQIETDRKDIVELIAYESLYWASDLTPADRLTIRNDLLKIADKVKAIRAHNRELGLSD